jgi:hypothetical protein
MGKNVARISVSRDDRRQYREKVHRCLDVLARMLQESQFEVNRPHIGLEIEFNLVDRHGDPLMRNAEVLDAIADPAWETELGQFNLELNLPPRVLGGGGEFEREIGDKLKVAEEGARSVGGRLMMIGMLPTLRESDMHLGTLSHNHRYKLLNEQIFAARGEDMHIVIDGAERLDTYADCIMPESACTSVQSHVQVSPDDFGPYWNAAQAIAGAEVAVAANSPFLFGHELWHETRIILFEQATDTRPQELKTQGVRPRVWFGERWITSVFELFEENTRFFPALLPICEDEDPAATLAAGGIPRLSELTLHNGTVYRWNRPVYAVVGDRPHLRVENRVLPSGPTVSDVIANSAFYYGLIRYLAEEERPVWSRLAFKTAEDNLRSAARHGIEAPLNWPGMGELPASELILRRLLPMAHEGLERWGVGRPRREQLLGIIEQRCRTGQTGAAWQIATLHAIEETHGRDRHASLRLMTNAYIERMRTNEPVHTWDIGP